MDAVILVGGFARRMGALTAQFPKCLLEVAGKPIIQHTIEKLEQEKDIGRIFLSSNHRFLSHFAGFVDSHSFALPIRMVVENSRSESEKLGSVGALQFLLEQEEITGDLLVIGGDNLFRFPLAGFLAFYRQHRRPLIGLYDIGSRQEAQKFGVVSLDRAGRITAFVEKPARPASTLVSTAIYLLPQKSLPLIRHYIAGGNNPDALGYFISWLHRREHVMGYVFRDQWFDIGSVETYEQAKRKY